MLVLTRRPSESIIIANDIKITVVSIGPGRVKIGIEAPANVRIDRQEIHDKIEQAADVLSAVAGGEATNDAQNTLVGHGPDTATIVVEKPTPQAGQNAGAQATAQAQPGPTPCTTSASAPAAQAGTTSSLNKLSKFRFPRKPR